MAESKFSIFLTNDQLKRDAEQASKMLKGIGDSAEAEGARIDAAFKKAASSIGVSLAGISIGGFVKQMFHIRSEFQDTEKSMEVFLGSAEKAQSHVNELLDYAYYNMFEFSDLTKASAQLLAFGNNVNDVIPIIDKLSNIASGTKQPLGDMIDLYNKAKNIGKIDAMGLQQWAARGVVITDVLKDMGVEVDRSSVKFEHLEMVLNKVTSEGGMFHNLMASQMDNLSASAGQLKDTIAIMLNELGTKAQPIMKGSIDVAGNLVQNYEKIGKTILEIVAAYGVYRAAIIAITATINAQVAASEKLLTAESLENISKQNLVRGSAAYTAAVKAELIAQEQRAIAILKANLAQKQANLTQAQAHLLVLKSTGATYNEITAQIAKIGFAKKELAVATASIAAKNAEIAGNTANIASLNLLSIAKTKLTAITARLNATIMANPYVAAGVAVAALSYGIYKLATHQTEAEKAQKRLNEATNEFNRETISEQAEIDRLFNKLKNTSKESANYQKVKDEITSKYSSYLTGLKEEIRNLNDIDAAYKAISASAKQSAIDRAIAKASDRESEEYGKNVAKINENLRRELKVNESGENAALFDLIQLELKETGKLSDETAKKLEKFNKTYYGETKTYNSAKYWTEQLVQESENIEKLHKQILQNFGVSTNEYKGLAKIQVDAYISAMENALKKNTPNNEGVLHRIILNGKEVVFKSTAELEVHLRKLKEVKDSFTDKNNFVTFSQQLEIAKSEVTKLDTELKNLKKGVKPSSVKDGEEFDFATAIEEKAKALKEAQEKYNLLRHGTTSAPKDQDKSKDYTEQIKREEQSLARAYKDLEFAVEQARIDAMKEGAEKILAQNQLNYDKEVEQIKRQGEDLLKQIQDREKTIWEKKGKKFDPAGIQFTDADKKALSTYDAKDGELAKAELLKFEAANKKVIDDLARQYSTYAEKRLEIEKKFNDDLAELEKNNTDGKYDANIEELRKQLIETLATLDNEYSRTTNAVGQLFVDMKQKSVDEMRDIANQAQEMMDFVLSGKWDAEKAEEFGIKTEAQFKALNEEWAKSPEKLEAIKKAIRDLNEEANRADMAFNKMSAGLKKIFSSKGNKNELKTGLDLLSDGLRDVTTMGNLFADSLRSIGELSGSDIFSSIAEGLSNVMDVANSAMQGAQTGAAFGPAGAAIGATLGMVSSITKIFSDNKKHREELKKQIAENQMQAYLGEFDINRLYRERYEWVQKIGEATLYYISRQGDELKKQTESNARDQDELWKKLLSTQFKKGEHFEKTGLFGWGKGKIVTEWASLAGKTWEEIERLASQGKLSEEGQKYYEALKKAKEEGDDLAKRQEEFLEQVNETFTGSTYDSVVNGIIDGFKAGKRSATDFADTFENLMQSAVASSLKMLAEEKVRKFYEDFSAKASDKEGLTEREIDSLQSMWEDIISSLTSDAENLQKITGVTLGDKESKKGVTGELQQQMTEGTASQLVGLWNMTAMDIRTIKEQMNEYQFPDIKTHLSAVLGLLNDINRNTRDTAYNTDGIKEQFDTMNEKLGNIEKNTKPNNSRG
ncbi:MAG: hypothetical protein LBI45_08850 [Bacteroidales bacterium]|jgi:hypothetical protein|nr:hypothetical protein [Bacteroidales bacterium]